MNELMNELMMSEHCFIIISVIIAFKPATIHVLYSSVLLISLSRFQVHHNKFNK